MITARRRSATTFAHPDCGNPLIFTERGRTTAVAEIAHIRSAVPGGPSP